MKTASQFIDFFIHDVLDYSVLFNKSKNFIKTEDNFDILEVITTVIQMIEDKTKMKSIEIKTLLKDADFIKIKTDKKRLT